MGGIDSSGTIFALLDWLSQQEHYSSGDIYFIQRGYAARGIDGAYAEDYCYLLSRALFSDPVAYAKALARSTADDEAVQTLIMGGTACRLLPRRLRDSSLRSGRRHQCQCLDGRRNRLGQAAAVLFGKSKQRLLR